MRFEDLSIDPADFSVLCQRYHVTKLEVFGSYAREEAETDSDLDLLVALRSDVKLTLAFVDLH